MSLASYEFLDGFLRRFYIIRKKVELKLVNIVRESKFYNMEPTFVQSYCLQGGKYCADPNTASKSIFSILHLNQFQGHLNKPVDAIIEGVSQQCIFQTVLAKMSGDNQQNSIFSFIEYLEEVKEGCLEDPDILGCTKAIRSRTGNFIIEEQTLQECITLQTEDDNEFSKIEGLDKIVADSNYYNFRGIPAVFVNNFLIRGEIDPEITVSAICDSFKKRPKRCATLHATMEEENQYMLNYDRGRFKMYLYYLIMVGLVAASFIFVYIYIKKVFASDIELDLTSRAHTSLAQYHSVQRGATEL